MRLHFTRLARLEVIAEVALANDDQRLAHRVETVRREEKERFREAMARIRAIARYKISSGAR